MVEAVDELGCTARDHGCCNLNDGRGHPEVVGSLPGASADPTARHELGRAASMMVHERDCVEAIKVPHGAKARREIAGWDSRRAPARQAVTCMKAVRKARTRPPMQQSADRSQRQHDEGAG